MVTTRAPGVKNREGRLHSRSLRYSVEAQSLMFSIAQAGTGLIFSNSALSPSRNSIGRPVPSLSVPSPESRRPELCALHPTRWLQTTSDREARTHVQLSSSWQSFASDFSVVV